MKRTLTLLLLIIASVQCKKDKDKNDDGPTGLNKGLIAYFKLDNNFFDSTGNVPIVAHSTTGITAVPNRHNQLESAMEFDGGNMQAPVTELSANPITISLWVKPKAVINGAYLLQSNTGAFGIYQLQSTMGMAISVPATNSAMGDISKGWVHVAGTYDGKDINAYINGVLAKTTANPGKPDNTSQIAIGSLDGSIQFKGAIDDVRIYNRVLNIREIAALAELK